MTVLADQHRLRWVLRLSDGGYSCWQFEDDSNQRHAWIVNAAAYGWTAHLGPWSDFVPETHWLFDCHEVQSFITAAEAKSWVEEVIAEMWCAHEPTRKAHWKRGAPA